MGYNGEEKEWQVLLHEDFEKELLEMTVKVRRGVAAGAKLLKDEGPRLGRPHVDTLEGSRHSNMKELRFRADDGVWRVAFAFDIKRQAILLVAGDKSGGSQKQFYRQLIKIADKRFGDWQERQKEEENNGTDHR